MNFNKLKRQIIPIAIGYLLFDILIVGAFVVADTSFDKDLQTFERINKIWTVLPQTIANPFKLIWDLFTVKGLMGNFLNASFYTLIVFIGLFGYYKFKSRKKYDYQGEEHGSSDWSKNGEEYDRFPDGSEGLNRKEGFILSKNHYLGTDLRKVKLNKNILVVGGSGSGKSACFAKPNILQKLGSYVITDPKGELYRETSNYLRDNGYEVKVFNLINPDFSFRYNPLAHIRDHSDVDIIAQTIIMSGEKEGGAQDPFWNNASKMLLKACIYYVITVLPEEQQNLSSCLNIVRAGGSDETVMDKLFIDELKPEHPGRKEYENIRLGADKTKQSIAISLVSKLGHFDTPAIKRITTKNDFDFSSLGKRKVAFYIITPPDTDTYDYILTVFFGQLLQRLFSDAGKLNGSLPQPVYLLLDEFANIGQIPAFDKKLSTTRSYGISISIIVQSLDQLESLYKNTYENIIGNCDTQLFLGSQSLKTCEYFSKSMGQKTIKFQSKSVSKDKKEIEKQGVSFNEQRQGRELMTVDELKRLDVNYEILLVRGIRPIKVEKAWFFKYHPQRDAILQKAMRVIEKIPDLVVSEPQTMDVISHLEERVRAAKRKIEENKREITKDDEIIEELKEDLNIAKSNSNAKVIQTAKEEDFDLQRELERKFDELFGKNDN